MKLQQRVPDLGDFDAVEVVEVLVSVGEVIKPESPLVTLETDKATMDVPATAAGTVLEVHVVRGEKVGKGALLVTLEAAAQESGTAPEPVVSAGLPAPDRRARLVVLGAGPGGYAAAFRAADLGLDVILVERRPRLGGVCLNVGCIPSKALLHAARVMDEAKSMAAHGIVFDPPRIDLDRLRGWKDGIIERLTTGLGGLARQRKVSVLHGAGRFIAADRLEVTAEDGTVTVVFGRGTRGGLRAKGGPIPGFELAGADGTYHAAEAWLEDGDRVGVRCSAVPEPKAIRYAWGDAVMTELWNGEGLPAWPFRAQL